MKTLAARDVTALLDVVAELHDVHEPVAFPPSFLARLRRLIPSDEVGYGEVNPSEQRFLVHVWQHENGDEGVVVGDGGPDEGFEHDLWWSLRDTNPICRYRTASDDWTTACKVSDFATLHEFRRTPFYDAFVRGYADYYLDVSLVATPTRYQGLGLWRLGGRDFDERDRLVLQLLQPHLAARAQAVNASAELRQPTQRVEMLTAREREIIGRAAQGQQNDAIALELGIAPATVAKHLEHVYRKLGVPNRTAAAALLTTR